jgi:hypothetical protein
MDCDACNLRFHLIGIWERVLEVLRNMSHPSSSRVQRWLSARLERYKFNLDKWAAHKMQDQNQCLATAQLQRYLTFNMCKHLFDFNGKLKGSDEQMSSKEGYAAARISQSNHVFFNRPVGEQAQGLTVEQQQRYTVVSYYVYYTDNTEQTGDHAAQHVLRANKDHSESNPQLELVYHVSDKAKNYAGTITARSKRLYICLYCLGFVHSVHPRGFSGPKIEETKKTRIYLTWTRAAVDATCKCANNVGTVQRLTLRCTMTIVRPGNEFAAATLVTDTKPATGMTAEAHFHSIPGMGKEMCDMLGGLINQGKKRRRDAGGELACMNTAAEHARTTNSLGIKGLKAAAVQLVAGQSTPLTKKMPPGSSQFNEKQRLDDEHLRVFKFSNHGVGLLVQAPTATPCKVTQHLGDACATPRLNMKDTQQERIRATTARKAEREAKKGQNVNPTSAFVMQRTGDRAASTEQRQQDLSNQMFCPKCNRLFLRNEPAFKKHVEGCPSAPKKQTLKDLSNIVVGRVVTEAGEQAEAAARARRGTLLTFSFDSQQQLDSELCLVCSEGDWFVQGLSQPRFEIAAFLFKGCKVLKGSVNLQDPSALSQGSFPCDIVFELPLPALLQRGWAGKQRTWKVKPTPEQESFLLDNWQKDRKVTAAVLNADMETHFTGREELHMCKTDIQVMLGRFYSQAQKKGRPANEPEGVQCNESEPGDSD